MQQNKPLTLGSLFDGSGGFPLGGLLAGIKPVWASEVEPFPIRVTTKRLPFMKHYGDVSKMNGGEIEPVDIITFGSPCQDMSIAGKRSGLDGNRSSLFYEAIRIVKEMRCKTNGEYPRYICWENVPGAFSSNGGEDFKAVLDAVIGVVHEDAEVPMPENRRWPYADLYLGDGWSVAYRTLDAQYWGVPQRRKRIFLVADFGGRSAGKILFESEGLSGYSAEGFRAWQRAAGSFETRIGATGTVLNDQGGDRVEVTEDVAATLRAETHGHTPCVVESAGFCTEHSAKSRTIGYEEECSPTLRAGTVPAAVALENHPVDSRVKISEDGNVQTLTSRMGTGGNNVPLVMKIRSGCEGGGKGALIQKDKSATLACNNDQTLFEPTSWDGRTIAPTLTAKNAGGNQRMPDKDNFNCILEAYGICSKDSNAMKSDNPHSGVYKADTSRTLDGNGGNPSCNQGGIAIVAFTQNQRDEVRDLGNRSAVVCANAGTKQQTFVLQGSMIGRDDKNGPQGDGVNEDVSFTLNTVDRHAVYAMTTGGFPVTGEEVAPSLLAMDYKDPAIVNEPAYGIGRDTFNQGKNAKFAPSVAEEVQPTLVAKGPGAVCKPISFYPQMKAECQTPREDVANTLVNGTNPGFQNGLVENQYTVRRLTPTECARLQGFPDRWCADLGTENPSFIDMAFWMDVFETHRKIMGTSSKPKTEKQIRTWLKDPYSDAAEYKMWGNGVALPCVWFVLSGIVYYDAILTEKST